MFQSQLERFWAGERVGLQERRNHGWCGLLRRQEKMGFSVQEEALALGGRRVSASNIAGWGKGGQVLPESEGGGVLGG